MTNLTKKDIEQLTKERLAVLNSDTSNDILYSDETIEKADIIQSKIIKEFKRRFNEFECDFILDTYTHFGHCPNLLNDDNGKWGISSGGMQPVSLEDDDRIEGSITCIVEKEIWFPTIREAIWFYMNEE